MKRKLKRNSSDEDVDGREVDEEEREEKIVEMGGEGSENEDGSDGDGNDNDIDQGIDIINNDIIETSQVTMCKMSIAALGMQKDIIAKQEHLNDISMNNDQLVQENRMIAKELLSTGEEEEKEADQDYEGKLERLHEIEEEIEMVEQHNSIIRHVLECLITESNVNWVEDDEIREFILEE